jgi:N-acylneuraminate cytidylyltransferase
VPLKNIRPLGGKPLIAWSVEAARTARKLDRIIVSTDHDGIAAAARAAGAEVPFQRPADIAEDVPSELVTRHALDFHERETGRTVDVVVTIQPTTPFVRGGDIDGCISLLEQKPHFDSAFTVCKVHERPEWMFRQAADGCLKPYLDRTIQGERGVSQSLEPLYHPNGGAYATRRRTLVEKNLLIGPAPGGWPMSALRSVDIDEIIDFAVAETVADWLARNPDL